MHKPSVPHCRMVEGKAEAQRGEENGPGAQLAGWKSSGVRTAPLGAFHRPPPACCCPSLLFGSGCSWPTLPFISLSVPPPHGLSPSGGRLPNAPELGGRAVWGEARWGGFWVGEQAGGRSDGEMPGGWSGASATGETPASPPPQTGEYVKSHRLVGDPVCLPSGPHCRAGGVSALVEMVTRLHLCTWCPAQHMSSMAKDSSPTSCMRSELHGLSCTAGQGHVPDRTPGAAPLLGVMVR